MSYVEVMITSIVAALVFSDNTEQSRVFLQNENYIPKMLKKSHFIRRLHKAAELLFIAFQLLGCICKQLNAEGVYVIESFPVSAYENCRIQRCHRYAGESWWDYQACHKRYFCLKWSL
jgi:hypothetical protein